MLGELFSTAVEGDGQVADALEIFPRAGELSRLFGLLAQKRCLKRWSSSSEVGFLSTTDYPLVSSNVAGWKIL